MSTNQLRLCLEMGQGLTRCDQLVVCTEIENADRSIKAWCSRATAGAVEDRRSADMIALTKRLSKDFTRLVDDVEHSRTTFVIHDL